MLFANTGLFWMFKLPAYMYFFKKSLFQKNFSEMWSEYQTV